MLNLTPDELLLTTRAVRKRLDFTRPVPRSLIEECLAVAMQAPSASNGQRFQYVLVSDPGTKRALADLNRRSGLPLGSALTAADARRHASSAHLMAHLHEVPWLVIPCVEGRLLEVGSGPVAPASRSASAKVGHDAAVMYGTVFPSIWSFMLAARVRALGTVFTTRHLHREEEAAEVLGIPFRQFTQVGLIPVAYSIGTDFRVGVRRPVADIAHWDRW